MTIAAIACFLLAISAAWMESLTPSLLAAAAGIALIGVAVRVLPRRRLGAYPVNNEACAIRLGTSGFLELPVSDERLIRLVDDWVRLMESEDYDAAFAFTAQSANTHWSPDLLRDVVKGYGQSLPTQRVTLLGASSDISQRKDVNRFPENRHGNIGYVWYDLNIDGVVSDLTATFDIRCEDDALAVVLDDIHVM